MEFRHCICTSWIQKCTTRSRLTKHPPTHLRFQFCSFQNYVHFFSFFLCTFLELRTRNHHPPCGWKKGPSKTSHGWISTPPRPWVFFPRRTSKTRFLWSFASWLCGRFVVWWPCASAEWWGPLGSDDGDDGKTRSCGVLWVEGVWAENWLISLNMILGLKSQSWMGFSLRKQPLNGSFTLAKGPNI